MVEEIFNEMLDNSALNMSLWPRYLHVLAQMVGKLKILRLWSSTCLILRVKICKH